MRYLAIAAACMALMWSALADANAAEIEVKMLNKGAKGVMVFEPDLVRIQPGDSVHFVAVNKGHDAQSIEGMLPEGAEPFAGEMSKDVTVTFTVPGVYGVKCKPHYPMGMVALVVVGTPANADEAKAVKHPGKAKKTFEALFEEYQKTAPQ
jgi:pseudoazurin